MKSFGGGYWSGMENCNEWGDGTGPMRVVVCMARTVYYAWNIGMTSQHTSTTEGGKVMFDGRVFVGDEGVFPIIVYQFCLSLVSHRSFAHRWCVPVARVT